MMQKRMMALLIALTLLPVFGCGDTNTSEFPGLRAQTKFFTNNPSMVVANQDGTVSIIDTTTDTVSHTLTLPAGANPPKAAYVVYSAFANKIFVGDNANARVVVFSGVNLAQLAILNTDSDAFHMWPSGDQLWVVDRTADAAVVFDIITYQRLATVPIPADLQAAGGTPHDVTVDNTHAYMSVLGLTGVPDVVVKYDRQTFQEVGRVNVGEDPHVVLNPINSNLYAACEASDDVFVIDKTTLQATAQTTVPGAHGVWIPAHGQTLYTTNFPGRVFGAGTPGLLALNLTTNQLIGSVPPPATRPHNVFGTADGKKIYVTHTNGGSVVSVYTADTPGAVPQPAGQVQVGQDPFGITLFPGNLNP